MYHRPWKDTPEEQKKMKFIEIQGFEFAVTHVICVHKGYIHDGSLGITIKMSKESIQWIIGDDNFALKCYEMEKPSKVKKVIGKTITKNKQNKT